MSLALALVLLSAAAARPKGSQQVDIIHMGCFHGSEVSDRSSGKWLGLYLRGETFELVSCNVQVEPCHDGVSDPPGGKSGRAVVVDADGTPLFLVRGLGDVGPKPVTIVTAKPEDGPGQLVGRGSRYLRPGEHLRLTLGRAEYRLAAMGKYDPTRSDNDRLVLGYRLTLTGPGGQSQDLAAPSRFAEDGVPSLVWAGDLDRDGKLDLYMDFTDHYNVSDYVLLLSSHAAAGRLVKKVASRRYVGC